MGCEVVIMYSDLSIVRVPWERRETMKRDRVLFIAISQPDPRLPGGRRKQETAYEEDWYMLYTEGDWFILYGFSFGQFIWHSLSIPWGAASRKKNRTVHDIAPWLPKNATYFEGEQVSKEVWAKALLKYKEMR